MSEQSLSLLNRVFEITTAFLLPGLIPLFALAFISDPVALWFKGAQDGPTFVGLLFVLLAALAVGMVITSIRWFVFEKLKLPFGFLGCPWVKPPGAFNAAQRKDHEAQYVDLRHQHYYHYLASANMAVAIPLALSLWKVWQPDPQLAWSVFGPMCGVAVAAFVILGLSGCEAIRRYDDRRRELLGPARRSNVS